MKKHMKRVTFLLLTLIVFGVTANYAKGKSPKPKAKHVLVLGLDGWGSYSVEKAHDIPNIRALMEQGSYTLKKRSVLPSESNVNWASMFNGSCPELHGYTTWGSRVPEIPSVELNRNGKFPTIFSILRDARPNVVTGCLTEWDGIKHVVDTMSIDDYSLAKDWENHHERLSDMAVEFIKSKKPTLLAVCWDQVDHTGHKIGHDTPEYYLSLSEVDGYIGRVIQALKDAGIYDQTIIIVTADHGGIGQGHGGKTLREMEHPFIIAGPGIKSGNIITEPMMQYDTAATIAYIFGLETPRSWVGRPALSAFKKK